MVWIRLTVILCLMGTAPILSGKNLYKSGQKYLKLQQFKKAKKAFYQYYKRHPNSFKAPYALYRYTQLLANANQIIGSLKVIAKRYPNFPELDLVFDQLASLYYIMENYAKTYYYYNQIMKRFTKSPYRAKASYHVIKISLIKKDYLKVESLAKSILPTLHNGIYYKRIILLVGRAYFLDGRYKKALSLYKKLIKHYPHSKLRPRILFRIAQCYVKLNKHRKSQKYFNKLINKHPNSLEKEYAKRKVKQSMNPSKPRERQQIKYKTKRSYTLQLGVFSARQNALKLKNKVQVLGQPCYIITYQSKGKTYYKTIAGPFRAKKRAVTSSNALARKGIKNILIRN